ncbi:hypothetical protein GWI72_12130 [Microvirga tunisiensis]|uniref:Uncharacterized protein n=2 Tax=Pannonibacter tanglangensis TaxID=2750084 RepID=A0ABW9ZP34_9HYPH|nr:MULTISPECIES: hypothetical protein [unclassified Pannonibacter]NBN64485.1 hypothetical protein [Pannonibacter sp. XCT-34]NBN79017.1 hypothetical protein [Pannonibacter sp. XCT-53]
MPAQDDPSLSMINVNNAGFGTLRLDPAAEAGNYRDHLLPALSQMPSVYYGTALATLSVRLRPLHEHGFVATGASTRLYFAVAGMLDDMQNPRTALSTSWENVGGPVMKSRYYVYARLGVSGGDVLTSVAALQAGAEQVSTAELVAANGASNVSGPTRVAYVTDGALAGTFWAFKHAGWRSSILPDAVNRRYRPLCLMDFRIDPAQVGAARADGADFGATLALVPAARNQVHLGHGLIDVQNLRAFYQGQTYASPVGNVAGNTIWTNFNRLGTYQQRASYQGFDGVAVTGPLMRGGEQYFPLGYFRTFPVLAAGLPANEIAQRQCGVVAAMINGFVNA